MKFKVTEILIYAAVFIAIIPLGFYIIYYTKRKNETTGTKTVYIYLMVCDYCGMKQCGCGAKQYVNKRNRLIINK